jgi:hypothetical protein
MTSKVDWENQIGRRLKLRDLHVFFTAVQHGSMGKAAKQLGISQPAVSEVIADLEHSLGVRLLDRSPQGIEPTIYGRANPPLKGEILYPTRNEGSTFQHAWTCGAPRW